MIELKLRATARVIPMIELIRQAQVIPMIELKLQALS